MTKKTILPLLFFLATAHSNAQETIARFKYEDAEKAFVAENYQECIDNLDEAEKLLGNTAPNILHLKILAQHKLVEKDPFESFERLQSLHNDCITYLRDYDISGLEEKYRDVYEIQDFIGEYPKTLAEFTTIMEKQKQEIRAVFENYIEALGGREALGRVNSLFVKGKKNIQGSVVSFEDKIMAGKSSRTMFFQIRKNKRQVISKSVSNGDKFFIEDKDGNRTISEATEMKGMPTKGLFPELEWVDLLDDPYYNFKLLKKDGYNHVQIVYANGAEKHKSVMWSSYDANTDLCKYKKTHYFEEGEDDSFGYTLVNFDDFREINGIKLPFSKKVTMKDNRITGAPKTSPISEQQKRLEKTTAKTTSTGLAYQNQASTSRPKSNAGNTDGVIQANYVVEEVLINQGVEPSDFEP